MKVTSFKLSIARSHSFEYVDIVSLEFAGSVYFALTDEVKISISRHSPIPTSRRGLNVDMLMIVRRISIGEEF